MKCQSCDKRDATIHLTEIKNKQKEEMHLCEQCAQEKGITPKQHFPISELLQTLSAAENAQKKHKIPSIKCPNCGITLAQFRSSGRFGCSHDYVAFREHIGQMIEGVHDSTQHVGKIPPRAGEHVLKVRERKELHEKLKAAVEREDYEDAAKVRDKLKELEKDEAR